MNTLEAVATKNRIYPFTRKTGLLYILYIYNLLYFEPS